MPGPGQVRHRDGMGTEQVAAQGRAGTALVAGVLGGGVIGLYGGITALAYAVASSAHADQSVALPGAVTVLGYAGLPAGVAAVAVGVNAARRIRARRQTGYAEVTAGWVSGTVGLVLYAAAAGWEFLAALYYYG